MKHVTMTVADAMTLHAVSIRSDDQVFHALQIIKRCGFRHLPVVDDGELVGMVSDRDLLRHLPESLGPGLAGLRFVRDVMTKGVITCRKDERVGDAIDRMLHARIDALVVTGPRSEVLGILTSTDLLSALRRIEGVIDVAALLKPSA